MRNVFQLFSNIKSQFTAQEKTLLGDIAMDFRSRDIHAKLCLYPQSQTALAKFIDVQTGEQYIHITKHSEGGIIKYEVMPIKEASQTHINFKDALIACKNYIQTRNAIPEAAIVFNFQIYRRG